MNTATSWENLLTNIADGQHIAQVYQEQNFLAQAVTIFITTGIRKQEAVLIIATQSHWAIFDQYLKKEGIDTKASIARGQLTVLDAHEVLDHFMVHDRPDWEKFKEAIEPVIKKIKVEGKYAKIRAYGEMVDVLWRKGNLQGAIRLEELWNEFMKQYVFSLFCAYMMDGLNVEVNNGSLQAICKTHSHLIPIQDYERFEEALNEACHKVLGSSLSSMLRTLASSDSTLSTSMPPAQAVLLWLKENMPVTADKLLSVTRQCLEPTP